MLSRNILGEERSIVTGRISQLDRQRTALAPDTILTRSWNGRPQRVMVMANGFGWDGKVYHSLSKVAFAITGTRWNGPRFFGLRDADLAANRHSAGRQR